MDRRRKTAVLYLLAGVAFLVGAVLESPRWFSYVPAVLFVVLAILQFSGLRRQRRP
jgi:membrane protein implicated in regulation of membrane protease activity